MIRRTIAGALAISALSACAPQQEETIQEISCQNAIRDSQMLADGSAYRINSAREADISRLRGASFHRLTGVRQDRDGNDIHVNYAVFEPSIATAGTLVLIPGGQMKAGIDGFENGQLTLAGPDYLVRSAHLYAEAGFIVVVIDRPSDFTQYLQGNSREEAYDNYRISQAHAVDLSSVIEAVNGRFNNRHSPLFIAGTDRGAISAIAQHQLAGAVALSSPVTSGEGYPVANSSGHLDGRPEIVNRPAQIIYHSEDACQLSRPDQAERLPDELSNSPSVTAARVSGGFDNPTETHPCKAETAHGFFGIESCVAELQTDWIQQQLGELARNRPGAASTPEPIVLNAQNASINLDRYTSATSSGRVLKYALPFTTTTLGGSITINGNVVEYTRPPGVTGAVDKFVYVVNETFGGTNNNVISIQL